MNPQVQSIRHTPSTALPSNLPAHLPTLIGREQELQTICQTFLSGDQRLLTLCGAGGSGKTRLALEIARALLPHYSEGVWMVELAGVGDADVVPRAVASALSVREVPRRPVLETIRRFLQERKLMLLLDNCEHLVDACAHLADDLLRACPDLVVLATSREPLRISGESTWRVTGLNAPNPEWPPSSPADLEQYGAAVLFAERARAARPDFAIGAHNVRAIGEICGRLGGLPLAMELAAARVRVLSPAEIAASLDDSFRLLTTGSRTAPGRQQTLRATLDWSHDLLNADERALFRRLAVFAGGFDLTAAEAVGAQAGIERIAVLDLMARLVDKSLVLADQPDGTARFRLLEPTRQYARERLVESSECPVTEAQHAAHFLELAERAERKLRGPEQDNWLDQLELEHDNLRAALRTLHRSGDLESGLRLGAALADFWWLRGHFSAGLDRLQGFLSAPGAVPSRLRARALLGLGMLEYRTAAHEAAHTHLAESIRLARRAGDLSTVAEALAHLGRMAIDADELERAQSFLEESLEIARATGDRAGVARGLGHLGTLAMFTGQQELARERLGESQELARALGDRFWVAVTHLWLTFVALELHDTTQARAELRLLDEAIDLRRHRWLVPWMLHATAQAALLQGRVLSAVRLTSAAEAQHDLLGAPLPAVFRRHFSERLYVPAQQALGESAWQAARAEGQQMTEAAALAQARELISTAPALSLEQPVSATVLAAERLSRREREVAKLVARGLSDRQIAALLVVSRRTAESHVAHCLSKLGLSSRAGLAAWAVEVGLTSSVD
jgi:predicted ATPase/DNA-binding NarL/FixJ family response regulator